MKSLFIALILPLIALGDTGIKKEPAKLQKVGPKYVYTKDTIIYLDGKRVKTMKDVPKAAVATRIILDTIEKSDDLEIVKIIFTMKKKKVK